MKICFPVMENQGLESSVFGHFGTAPMFLIVDTTSNEITAIHNGDRIHRHGTCSPLAGIGGEHVDAIAVGGIGGGALFKLNSAGIRVFQAHQGSVRENILLFNNNDLMEFMPGHTCGGHGNSHGCGTH